MLTGRLLRPIAVLSVLSFLSATAATPAEAAGCPERPSCRGCGCKGGPGYRGPDGQCVGYRDLDKVCGVPPGTRCVFENAPGTGMNKDCALGGTRKNKPAR